jgi:hypothetical protein
MAKPALGKGLNQLMSGQSAARKPVSSDPAEKVTAVDFGRGMTTLVSPPAVEPQEPEAARTLLPPWFFFAADILLLAYTIAICLDAGGPMETGEILFAFASTTLAALLGIMGVIRSRTH